MDVVTLIFEARRLGLKLRAESELLIVSGPRTCEALALRLKAHKPEVMAVLSAEDEEVQWRVAAMTPQVPPLGPIPSLSAPSLMATPGTSSLCGSCGEPLMPSRRYRCLPCQHASWLVLMRPRD